uniref:Single-stranded DNA-binding protein n=1 Tax=Glossina brevipalpis TaxID=37001 RepID=A0A1A9WSH8_9MUSC
MSKECRRFYVIQALECRRLRSNVTRDLAATGIKKEGKNAQQGFRFRGIDQVYTALAPVLAKYGLVILPRIVERTVTERATTKGGVLFYVTVKAEFDFVATEDGSKHTVTTYGEAMSIAYKYAAFQAFCIPTEETAIDADAEVHEVAAPTPDDILKSFTEQAMTVQSLHELQMEFGKIWKPLNGTAQHSLPVKQGYGEHEKVTWVQCRMFGARAEKLPCYLTKGTKVTVTGQFVLESWTAKDGTEKSTPVVIVNEIDFTSKQEGRPQQNKPTVSDEAPPPFDDNIPF